MTKELERKVEAMGESIGRVILQGMLEDAWDKGVEQERRRNENTQLLHSFLLEYQKKKY